MSSSRLLPESIGNLSDFSALQLKYYGRGVLLLYPFQSRKKPLSRLKLRDNKNPVVAIATIHCCLMALFSPQTQLLLVRCHLMSKHYSYRMAVFISLAFQFQPFTHNTQAHVRAAVNQYGLFVYAEPERKHETSWLWLLLLPSSRLRVDVKQTTSQQRYRLTVCWLWKDQHVHDSIRRSGICLCVNSWCWSW